MRTERTIAALAFATAASVAVAQQHVTEGPALDDQASVITSSDDGARIVVFERLDASTLYGDLWLTRSTDGGATWSSPNAIIASASNERHPALAQLGPSHYALFYLKGESATSSFRIFRATSDDGVAFTEQAPLDLGWASGGEVNPHVIRHVDGTLTMSYQRLTGGVFVAESSDDGVTWDTLKTEISDNAQLPRITYRESDGLYLASYQRGSNALHILVKTTRDMRDWSGAEQPFAPDGNNHDSLPIVMPDDAFAVFWIRAAGPGFDIFSRRSANGVDWEPALRVTDSPDADDVEPHPLVGASSSEVELYWGRDDPAGSLTHDIVRLARVVVADRLFAASFDG
jgi:hypothetical protein